MHEEGKIKRKLQQQVSEKNVILNKKEWLLLLLSIIFLLFTYQNVKDDLANCLKKKET